MAEISWNDDMTICYGVSGLSPKEFYEKAREEHLVNTGEDLPEDTVVGKNQWNTWVMKCTVR